MPTRAYKLNIGYDTQPEFPPIEKSPPSDAGLAWNVFQVAGRIAQTIVAPGSVIPDLAARGTLGAAFRLENDVLAAVDLYTRPKYTFDPSFQLEEKLKEAGLWDDYRWNFVGVHNEQEFLDVAGRIKQEEMDKRLLQAAGPDGFVALALSGLASPVNLLPFVGPGVKGAKAIAMGLGWGLLGGAAQEVPLQMAQETRTAEESTFSIALSTVLGGVLGGAVGYLNKSVDAVARDMYATPGASYIPGTSTPAAGYVRFYHGGAAGSAELGGARFITPDLAYARAYANQSSAPQIYYIDLPEDVAQSTRNLYDEVNGYYVHGEFDVEGAGGLKPFQEEVLPTTTQPYTQIGTGELTEAGAASARRFAGTMKSALGMEEGVLSRISPVTRVLSQKTSKVGAWIMSQLADAGVTLENNAKGIATSVGGTAENRIRTYQARVAESVRELDSQYAQYMLGPTGRPTAVTRLRANLASMAPGRTKLSKKEFKEAVGRAMRQGDQHEIPEVAATAAFVRKTIYDPLFKAAQEAGIFKTQEGEEILDAVVGDVTYLNRDYNITAVQARRAKFESILVAHFERKLQDEFQEALPKLLERLSRIEQRVGDLKLAPDEVNALREQFQAELKGLDEARTPEEIDLEEFIADARSLARDKTLTEQQRKDARDMAKLLEERGGADLAQRNERRRALRRRLRNLNRSFASRQAQQVKKLDKIDRIEELQMNSLNRAMRAGQKFLTKAADASDESMADEIAALRNRFEEAAAKYDRMEERIRELEEAGSPSAPTTVRAQQVLDYAKAAGLSPNDPIYANFLGGRRTRLQPGDTWRKRVEQFIKDNQDRSQELPFDPTPLTDLELQQLAQAGKLTRIAAALEDAEAIAPEDLRALVQEGMDEMLAKVNGLNSRRALRAARLKEQAEDLDPARVQEEIDSLNADARRRYDEFRETWRVRGAEDVDVSEGFRPNFRAHAEEIARTATDRILGSNARLAGMDLVMEPRGAEMARVLDIPSNEIEEFLENDIEHLIAQYVRTLAPDIEIRGKLGDYAPDTGRNMEFTRLNEEESAAHKALDAKLDKNEIRDQAVRDRAHGALSKEYVAIRRDLTAVIGRLRHTWGVPSDPTSFMTRAGRVAMNLNVLRYMNMVTISSIPDVAQAVMKYGLLRTFKSGYVPFIKQLARLDFDNRELRLAGATLDMVLHSRAHQISDVGDYMVRGSRFEKGMEYASSRIGLIALFDVWTTAMKQISGTVANATMMDDLRLLIDGGGTAKQRARSTERLAASGIDAETAQAIWRQITREDGKGANIVDGVLWPNTESWDDPAAVMAYRAAILREVERTIITPGVERPLLSDSTLAGRLMFQFKSFALSSTSKTAIAALQQHDMAVVNGIMLSLAMGTVSYYIAAKLTGGNVEAEMEAALADALSGNKNKGLEKFADEAISRSGLLAAMGMAQDIASTVPAVAPYVTLSGERTSRQAGNDFWQALLGPTYDLGSRLHAGTSWGENGFTSDDARQLRKMVPLQNHFALRQWFDAIEKAFPEPN